MNTTLTELLEHKNKCVTQILKTLGGDKVNHDDSVMMEIVRECVRTAASLGFDEGIKYMESNKNEH